jgi:hypothetical protein
LDISSGIQSYIKDITNGPTNAPFWNDSEFVIYTKTDVPGLWVGYNITKNYRDLNVNYNISMSLQSSTSNIATTGTATYGGRGTVLYNNSVIVANVSGGPWDCNVNIPTDTGSGTPIILTWVDSVVDTLLPNQDHTCARAILNETTTP